MNSRGRKRADWEHRHNKRVAQEGLGVQEGVGQDKADRRPHMSTFVVRDFGVTFLKG